MSAAIPCLSLGTLWCRQTGTGYRDQYLQIRYGRDKVPVLRRLETGQYFCGKTWVDRRGGNAYPRKAAEFRAAFSRILGTGLRLGSGPQLGRLRDDWPPGNADADG